MAGLYTRSDNRLSANHSHSYFFTDNVIFRLQGSLTPSGTAAAEITVTFSDASGMPKPARISRTLAARAAAIMGCSTITDPFESFEAPRKEVTSIEDAPICRNWSASVAVLSQSPQ